jgi:hypothetical protein
MIVRYNYVLIKELNEGNMIKIGRVKLKIDKVKRIINEDILEKSCNGNIFGKQLIH